MCLHAYLSMLHHSRDFLSSSVLCTEVCFLDQKESSTFWGCISMSSCSVKFNLNQSNNTIVDYANEFIFDTLTNLVFLFFFNASNALRFNENLVSNGNRSQDYAKRFRSRRSFFRRYLCILAIDLSKSKAVSEFKMVLICCESIHPLISNP